MYGIWSFVSQRMLIGMFSFSFFFLTSFLFLNCPIFFLGLFISILSPLFAYFSYCLYWKIFSNIWVFVDSSYLKVSQLKTDLASWQPSNALSRADRQPSPSLEKDRVFCLWSHSVPPNNNQPSAWEFDSWLQWSPLQKNICAIVSNTYFQLAPLFLALGLTSNHSNLPLHSWVSPTF